MDAVTLTSLSMAQCLVLPGLLFLMGRGLPPQAGVGLWALGGGLFGMASLVRPWVGVQEVSPLSVPIDTAQVMAVLLFIGGVRQYLGLGLCRPQKATWMAGTYATTHLLVLTLAGPSGRWLVVYGVLGLLYAALAWHFWLLVQRGGALCRVYATVLSVGVGLLAAFTLWRAQWVLGGDEPQALVQLGLTQWHEACSVLCVLMLGAILVALVRVRRQPVGCARVPLARP